MCVHYQLRGMSCRTTVCEAFQGQDIWKKNYYYYSASLGSYLGLKVKLLFYTMSDWLMWTVVHNQSSWLMNPGSWAVIMNVHDLGSHATGSQPTLSLGLLFRITQHVSTEGLLSETFRAVSFPHPAVCWQFCIHSNSSLNFWLPSAPEKDPSLSLLMLLFNVDEKMS